MSSNNVINYDRFIPNLSISILEKKQLNESYEQYLNKIVKDQSNFLASNKLIKSKINQSSSQNILKGLDKSNNNYNFDKESPRSAKQNNNFFGELISHKSNPSNRCNDQGKDKDSVQSNSTKTR